MKKIIYIFSLIIFLGSCGLQKSLLTQQSYDDVYMTQTPATTNYTVATTKNQVTQKHVSNIPIDTLYADQYSSGKGLKDTIVTAKSGSYQDYDLDYYDDNDYYGDLYDYDLRLRLLYDGFYPDFYDWYWNSPYYYGWTWGGPYWSGYFNGYWNGYWDGYWDGTWGYPYMSYCWSCPGYYWNSFYWYGYPYYYYYKPDDQYNNNSDYRSRFTYGHRGGDLTTANNQFINRRRFIAENKRYQTNPSNTQVRRRTSRTNNYTNANRTTRINRNRSRYLNYSETERYTNTRRYNTNTTTRTSRPVTRYSAPVRQEYNTNTQTVQRRSRTNYNSYSYPRSTYRTSENFHSSSDFSRSSYHSNFSSRSFDSFGSRSSSSFGGTHSSTTSSSSSGRRR